MNQVNRQHCSALWMAAQSGAVKTAEILLHYNLDIEGAGTQNLVTPLWIASQNGHLEVHPSYMIKEFNKICSDC